MKDFKELETILSFDTGSGFLDDDSSELEEEVAESLLKERNDFDIQTNFHFLKSVKGLKKGVITTFLGETGAGKSSVVRSLLNDVFESDSTTKYVWLHLSEEKKVNLKVSLYQTGLSRYALDRITLTGEQDFADLSQKERFKKNFKLLFEEKLSMSGAKFPDVFIFDNITTSCLYRGTPNDQENFVEWIKDFFSKYHIACVIIAHTGKDKAENSFRRLNSSYLRGNGMLANISEVFFNIENFYEFGDIRNRRTIINIEKHRNYQISNRDYLLRWSREKMVFDKDLPLDSKEMGIILENSKTKKR